MSIRPESTDTTDLHFTIVVPCYKVALERQLIEGCLASIAMQTDTSFELILVNDASPDATQAILQELVSRDEILKSRAQVLDLPENVGVCGARNAGIEAAHGRFVAFLDYDDCWHPRFLEMVWEAALSDPTRRVLLVRTDLLTSLGRRSRVSSFGSLEIHNASPYTDFLAWHLLNNFPVGMGSATVVERSLLLENENLRFDPNLSRSTAEDVLFGYQVLRMGVRPHYVDEPLCLAKRMLGRMSRSTAAHFKGDERSVVDYISSAATDELQRRVVMNVPRYAHLLSRHNHDLRAQLDLKNHWLNRRFLAALRAATTYRRGWRSILRLLIVDLLARCGAGAIVNLLYYVRIANDEVARERSRALLESTERYVATLGQAAQGRGPTTLNLPEEGTVVPS
ncbi:glycosyltransferase [Kineosporia sp. A_224]|uniref:glycosyltransferase family 2 protein n=1 Tax=Kineosporia sp. A_224 TaxID=1962180 RepID=UPI000B4C0245|nr:glycosyltransferase [Kineosporia sp. A_224]